MRHGILNVTEQGLVISRTGSDDIAVDTSSRTAVMHAMNQSQFFGSSVHFPEESTDDPQVIAACRWINNLNHYVRQVNQGYRPDPIPPFPQVNKQERTVIHFSQEGNSTRAFTTRNSIAEGIEHARWLEEQDDIFDIEVVTYDPSGVNAAIVHFQVLGNASERELDRRREIA